MTTALFLLRTAQLGIPIRDLELLTAEGMCIWTAQKWAGCCIPVWKVSAPGWVCS